MASDTDHTCCTHSPTPMGASHCLNRDVPDYPCSHALTRERRGVEKALCRPSRCPVCARIDGPGLCGSDGDPRMAASPRGDRDRTPPRRWHPTADPRPRATAPAGGVGADLLGDGLMLQLSPQTRIL